MLPNLRELALTRHKGQNGKVGVIGGSKEYTGAPFYAGMASLRAGADISHIFTPAADAVTPIKSYSPELIVHHVETPQVMIDWLPALTSVVIGPGLGRDTSLPHTLQ